MPLGMEMLMQSMGVDPAQLQGQINQAVEHVKNISQRITVLEQVAVKQAQMTAALLDKSDHVVAGVLRIEDAIDGMRRDTPDNSAGFVAQAVEQMPDAAQEMNKQLEETNQQTTTDV